MSPPHPSPLPRWGEGNEGTLVASRPDDGRDFAGQQDGEGKRNCLVSHRDGIEWADLGRRFRGERKQGRKCDGSGGRADRREAQPECDEEIAYARLTLLLRQQVVIGDDDVPNKIVSGGG